MQPVNLIVFICFLSHFAESTDLVISYKGNLKVVKNAESTERSNITITNLSLSQKFGFPMALHYIENDRQLLLSDFDNDDVDIYSISLNEENQVHPLVKSTGTTQIESITYDPLLHKLYWSDVFRYGIYTNSTMKSRSRILYETGSMEPRSIALDSCNQILYWSDRDSRNPKLSAFDLKTKNAAILKSSFGETFFHSIIFDSYDNQLWWFETDSDESSKTSCKIMKKTVSGSSLYTTIDHCYPFSITFDKDFLYWNDWGREALLRLSKTNPSDLLEILYTPKEGKFRAYGIANINRVNHFDCDVDLVLEQNAAFLPSFQDFIQYSNDEDENGNMKSLSEQSYIFPDKYTSPNEMKIMYNTLHKVEIIFLLLLFISTTILIFVVMKLYFYHLQISKNLQSKIIDVEALPPFGVTKPTKKYKKFVPRIIASQIPRDNHAADIENCCQMTLCDKPCEIAVNKGSRFVTKLKKSEDKHRLLDDSMA